jgi:hypothetical protein
LSSEPKASAQTWRILAASAYFLAVLIVLDPFIGFLLGAWPPHPSLLPWRHISSGLILAAAPMAGVAATGVLIAAKVRADLEVLRLLRLCGLGALILGAFLGVLYAVDSAKIYRDLPAAQGHSFVALETRMLMVLVLGLAFIWALGRAARPVATPT